MQHSGGSPFRGHPLQELAPAFPSATEAAAPISMRPPPTGSAFDDMGQQTAEEEQRMTAGEGGGAPGNRWPRQETVALLKIRSDMDATFRDATLKGPLWEVVSRKLGELGYYRSAKKCKEKFENVHKYYKRTKEGRAGRQDGKSYRFFSQLEALNSSVSSYAVAVAAADPAPPVMTSGAATSFSISGTPGTSSRPQLLPSPTSAQVAVPVPPPMATPGLSFSSNTSSYTGTESDEEVGEEGGNGRKRKRDGSGGGEAAKGSRKMMMFFEGLMRQVMERQEVMQQRFLEAIERREKDRMIREEAWRRQEMCRMTREHELAAQERAAAAARDATIISFLQKLTVQRISFPPPPPPPLPPSPSISAEASTPIKSPPPSPPPTSAEMAVIAPEQPPPSHLLTEALPGPAAAGTSGIMEAASSSRWPKSEVQALIKLRSGMEVQYQESGPKGPLWEEISAGMRRLGYNRSSKRCKEKWENINKYFKKVKESNKKRPEDAKTCPYFHQLDALYRNKLHSSGGRPEPELNFQPAQPLPPPAGPKNNETSGRNSSGFFEQGSSFAASTKKPEDFVKELVEQPLMDSLEDDTVASGNDEDEEDADEEDGDMQFKIQFQRPRVGGGAGAGEPSGEGNFLAMVR